MLLLLLEQQERPCCVPALQGPVFPAPRSLGFASLLTPVTAASLPVPLEAFSPSSCRPWIPRYSGSCTFKALSITHSLWAMVWMRWCACEWRHMWSFRNRRGFSWSGSWSSSCWSRAANPGETWCGLPCSIDRSGYLLGSYSLSWHRAFCKEAVRYRAVARKRMRKRKMMRHGNYDLGWLLEEHIKWSVQDQQAGCERTALSLMDNFTIVLRCVFRRTRLPSAARSHCFRQCLWQLNCPWGEVVYCVLVLLLLLEATPSTRHWGAEAWQETSVSVWSWNTTARGSNWGQTCCASCTTVRWLGGGCSSSTS